MQLAHECEVEDENANPIVFKCTVAGEKEYVSTSSGWTDHCVNVEPGQYGLESCRQTPGQCALAKVCGGCEWAITDILVCKASDPVQFTPYTDHMADDELCVAPGG